MACFGRDRWRVNDDDKVCPGSERKIFGVDDREYLSLQPVAFDCALEASARPEADLGVPLLADEHTNGERPAMDPSAPSVHRAEAFG